MSEVDSQASFSPSVRLQICETYGSRCVLCLVHLEGGGQCAHLIDKSSSKGELQIFQALRLGLLPMDFERSSADNGVFLCATCHLDYFRRDFIAFTPSAPLLQYINDYLCNTPLAQQLPLHELLDSIRNRDEGNWPDSSQIYTYIDLFTIVPLNSAGTAGKAISTYAEPQRFIFRNNNFELSARAALTNPNVIQMFNVVGIGKENPPPAHGPFIKFDPGSSKYHWQLPVDPQLILAMAINRLAVSDTIDDWEELRLLEQIYAKLIERSTWLAAARGDRGRGCGRGGNRGGGNRGTGNRGTGNRGGNRGTGNRGGGNRGTGNRGGGNRGTGNRGTVNRGTGNRGRGERKSRPNKRIVKGYTWKRPLDDELLSEQADDPNREKPHGVHPEEWDVASSFSTLVVDRPRSHFGSSAPSMHEDGWNEEDDPSTWNFGPSFRSDMIIASARQMMQI